MKEEPRKQSGKPEHQGNDQVQQSPGRDQSGSDSRTQGRQPMERDDEPGRDQGETDIQK